jgi:FAD:protein FMN transferase
MTTDLDYTFRAMGSDVRFLIGPPLLPSAASPLEAADREREFVLQFAQRLSRFEPASELSQLNSSPLVGVPASELLRVAVSAGIWAAARSGGLFDPTLFGALERAGYTTTLDGALPSSLAEALRAAPPRRPARPSEASRWREVFVDEARGVIVRPHGVRIDTGGTGKGLCADAVAQRLSGYTRVVVDCGGDIAVGGVGIRFDPCEIEIEHPLTGASIGRLRLTHGGVATSGLNVRIWSRPDGTFAHHLLDPSTGRPAWTGLIGVTAVAASALEAETLSKMALLLGPEGGRRVLTERGGVLVHDDSSVELVGPIDATLAAPPALASIAS